MDREGVVKRIEELAIPILTSEDLKLVDIEFKKEAHGLVLRFLIDREGGVDLDTCSRTSEVLSNLLDAEDLISSSYTLEVASPGIERPLKKIEDFKKFVGSKIYAKTKTKIKERKHFTGILKTAAEETFTIECEDLTIEIPYSEVSKTHLVVGFHF